MGRAQRLDRDGNDFIQEESEESEPVPQQISNNRIAASNIGQRPPSKTTTEGSLVPELSDEDLWMLIRRFNKVCYVQLVGQWRAFESNPLQYNNALGVDGYSK